MDCRVKGRWGSCCADDGSRPSAKLFVSCLFKLSRQRMISPFSSEAPFYIESLVSIHSI